MSDAVARPHTTSDQQRYTPHIGTRNTGGPTETRGTTGRGNNLPASTVNDTRSVTTARQQAGFAVPMPKDFRHTHRWRNTSKAIRHRDGTCQHCGTTHGLTVHHITPWRPPWNGPKWDWTNLITLCHTCHDRADIQTGASGRLKTRRNNQRVGVRNPSRPKTTTHLEHVSLPRKIMGATLEHSRDW